MSEKEKRRKLGRPPKKPKDRRLPSMSFRPTHDLRDMLEKAAADSGRSLSQEIEYRLWRSAMDDDARKQEILYKFSGSHNYAIALAMARIASQLGGQVLAPWTENEWIYRQVREAFDAFLDGIAPPAGADKTGGRFLSPKPENEMSGRELAEYWLEFLQRIAEMDEETKAKEGIYREPDNVRRIAFEVEPEIAPLIGRRK